MTEPLLAAKGLFKDYALPRERLLRPPARLLAVRQVDIAVESGRNFGIVGESGAGKSTLARLLVGLEPPSAGRVRFLGKDLNAIGRAELKRLRRHFQMVFQDPYGSLDPRQKVERIVAEPLDALTQMSARERSEAVAAALASVGLGPGEARKYPHEFSGGQRQRIALARALITRPKLIVADEPLSALDVSVQAQILNLLRDLGESHGVTLLLISHDLAVVEHLCDEIAVMYRGAIVEQAPTDMLFARPAHPYTRQLIAAAQGFSALPRSPSDRPMPALGASGTAACAYAGSCGYARSRCRREVPLLREIEPGHKAACHFAEEVEIDNGIGGSPLDRGRPGSA